MTANPYPAAKVGAAIQAAIAGSRSSGRKTTRRHPAEVTADRLLDALEQWPDRWDGEDRDAIGRIRHVLHQIADGARS